MIIMEPIDLILSIVYYAGEVDGRTRLQKIVYFVSEKLGLDLGFIPHYYGPYSSIVAKTLEDLVVTDFIEEYITPTLSGRLLYVYKLKPNVEENFVLNDEIKDLVKKLAKEDLDKVIVASKVHYLLKRHKDADSLPDEAKKYGWDIDNNDVREALKFLQELGLV